MSWLNELRRLLARARTEAPVPEGPPPFRCTEAMEHLFEWLDGELDAQEAGAVERHFEVCANCYPHLAFEKAFREALARAADEGGSCPDAVRSRIVTALEADGFTPPAT